MPGTWSLIDKEFGYWASALTQGTHYTLNSTNADTGTDIVCIRYGHMIYFRVSLVNKVAVGDTTLPMFTFNYNKIGINAITYTKTQVIGSSDAGEAIVLGTLAWDTGAFSTTDVNPIADGNVLPANSTTVWHIYALVKYDDKLDSACTKFWWRRTA
jgi:hypothetical protein